MQFSSAPMTLPDVSDVSIKSFRIDQYTVNIIHHIHPSHVSYCISLMLHLLAFDLVAASQLTTRSSFFRDWLGPIYCIGDDQHPWTGHPVLNVEICKAVWSKGAVWKFALWLLGNAILSGQLSAKCLAAQAQQWSPSWMKYGDGSKHIKNCIIFLGVIHIHFPAFFGVHQAPPFFVLSTGWLDQAWLAWDWPKWSLSLFNWWFYGGFLPHFQTHQSDLSTSIPIFSTFLNNLVISLAWVEVRGIVCWCNLSP